MTPESIPDSSPNGDCARLCLRPVRSEDDEFLYLLYADTRGQEMAAWGWDSIQQNAFLQMQFRAQRQGYAADYPDADHQLVCSEGQPIGRLIVHRCEHKAHLVDIAILTDHRNRGVGSELLRGLIAECQASGKLLTLQVDKVNRAIRLYQRLGFSTNAEDALFYKMSCAPASGAASKTGNP
jgi:ribosomal protein S18 acetylase RimI-like enzyme